MKSFFVSCCIAILLVATANAQNASPAVPNAVVAGFQNAIQGATPGAWQFERHYNQWRTTYSLGGKQFHGRFNADGSYVESVQLNPANTLPAGIAAAIQHFSADAVHSWGPVSRPGGVSNLTAVAFTYGGGTHIMLYYDPSNQLVARHLMD